MWTPVSSAQVTEEVSDITGEYRVSSQEMNDLWIDTYAGDYGAYMPRYVSDSTTDMEQWMIILYGFTDEETSMADVSNVYLDVDGRRIQPLEVSARVRTIDDEIMEVVETTYTEAIFTRIANANEVRVDVGDEAFQLRDREDMRMIVQTVNNQSSQTASSGDNR
ncbi:hypothetical protein CRI93_11540 [Longimonas halophila]|uniref:Uncharacterized protein n=1 Tax=Longimonas halophila TaxID=1469170 RepID=A0A2H3NJ95_9BACT|nr:hypothetical protein CRI93_11540 [Longimonas halophila]